MNDLQIANFFWHGQPLSLYETYCIKSFVKHNWIVNLWTFDSNINAPYNVNICDANIFYQINDIQTFTQRGKQGCIAAFSDAFRYKVLQKYQGWWFDTDCICLKDQSEFNTLKENKNIVAGYENGRGDINGAVLTFVNSTLSDIALNMMETKLAEKNRSIGWGEIGPKLITKLVLENKLVSDILSTEYFYPLHCKHAIDVINKDKTESIESITANSYVYHCWNEMLTRGGVNKNEMPVEGSFLYKKFKELDL